MADENYSPLSVRKLTPEPTDQPPPEQPSPPVTEVENDEPPRRSRAAEEVTIGLLFPDLSGVLPLLGRLEGISGGTGVDLYRNDENKWWVEYAMDRERLGVMASLTALVGGGAFVKSNNVWYRSTASGETGAQVETIPPDQGNNWHASSFAELIGSLELRSRRIRSARVVQAVVPVELSNYVLRRAVQLRLRVFISTARWTLLRGGDEEYASAILMRFVSLEHDVPTSFLNTLTELPYVIPCHGVEDAASPRIMVDLRYQLPIPAVSIEHWVPAGETWILSSGENGHRRLIVDESEIDGASLLRPQTQGWHSVPSSTPTRLPNPITVSLVRERKSTGRVDAVLVNDEELKLLARYLPGRPAGEIAFILPGPGVHLLLAPGGLPEETPIGLGLKRVGPGALYLEHGWKFFPSIPDGARLDHWKTDQNSVVVLLGPKDNRESSKPQVFGFSIDNLVPSWVLWVGEAPGVKSGLDGIGVDLLSRMKTSLKRLSARSMVQSEALRLLRPDSKRLRKSELLRQVQKAELAGDLLLAAELLEEAGESEQAARLYERMASE